MFGILNFEIKNLKFVGNIFNARSGARFITYAGIKDLLIENNNMNLSSIANLQYYPWFKNAGKNENAIIRGNNIKMESETAKVNRFFEGEALIEENKITIDADFDYIFCGSPYVYNNEVIINRESTTLYPSIFYYGQSQDLKIEKNQFIFNNNVTKNFRFLNFYNCEIGECKIQIYDNKVKGVTGQQNKKFIYFQNMQDRTPKTVYTRNNSMDFLSQVDSYENLSTYTIVEE